MSKSLGNLVFVRDLVADWAPAEIRLAALSHHYRRAWDWQDELLDTARARLERWTRCAGPGAGPLDEVRAALNPDLDTPRALEAIDRAAESDAPVAEAAALLGIGVGGCSDDAIVARHEIASSC